jgi:hypothetical protein
MNANCTIADLATRLERQYPEDSEFREAILLRAELGEIVVKLPTAEGMEVLKVKCATS